MFKFLSWSEIIDIAQIMIAIVLLVVRERILTYFGKRKLIFIVRNYKKMGLFIDFRFVQKLTF